MDRAGCVAADVSQQQEGAARGDLEAPPPLLADREVVREQALEPAVTTRLVWRDLVSGIDSDNGVGLRRVVYSSSYEKFTAPPGAWVSRPARTSSRKTSRYAVMAGPGRGRRRGRRRSRAGAGLTGPGRARRTCRGRGDVEDFLHLGTGVLAGFQP